MNIPKKVFGYEIINKIDETKKSYVFSAQGEDKKQNYIIKILKNNNLSKTEIARFKQEYEILKKLDFDGIIKVFDIIEKDNELAIVLEDFGGISLKQLIINQKLTIEHFLQLAIQIASSLHFLHQNNIIHKDIKPTNILIDQNFNCIKLIDFGISTDISSIEIPINDSEFIQGSLVYMSPEQSGRMNRKIDYRTDIYSFGITMYEMLTGTVPFVAEDALDIIHSHIAKKPLAPIEIDNSIPAVISDIVMKAMTKIPEERYQSCLGMIHDLSECQRLLKSGKDLNSFIIGQKDMPLTFIIPSKLYGREKEISQMLDAFERISQGAKEIIFISGDPGIGKSVLIAEIQKPVIAKRGFFINGKYEQFNRNQPYSSIINAFRGLVRNILTEDKEGIAKWKLLIIEALEQNGRVITDIIPELEIIIGEQPELPVLGAKETRERFNYVFKKFASIFAARKHPLVIFIDDLQWADAASLVLIKTIITDLHIAYLLMIIAYRNNEIFIEHQVADIIDDFKNAAIPVTEIQLSPLNDNAINKLLQESLKSSEQSVAPLAEIIFKKTGGNPFFINQFLRRIYEHNLLILSPHHSSTEENQWYWKWDIEKIKMIKITDNVIDLMVAKFLDLNEKTKEVLQIASCVGSSFNLVLLSSLLDKDINDIIKEVSIALNEGFIYIDNDNYKFEHDRIQEAIYSIIEQDIKAELHHKIGSYLLAKNTIKDLGNSIFYIVNQLNHGVKRLSAEKEKIKLAHLNLQAGIKAKNSSAFADASQYLAMGLTLLPPDSWKKQYELTISLFTESGEVAFLNGNHIDCHYYTDEVLGKATSILDKTQTYVIKMDYHIALNQTLKALAIGIQALNKLGLAMPEKQNRLAYLKEKFINLIYSKKYKIKDLVDLPEINDPTNLNIMRILIYCNQPSYVGYPEYFPLIALKQINFIIKHGNSELSPYAFVIYGLLNISYNKIDLAYAFGKLALELTDKFNARAIRCKIYFFFGCMINHWKNHYREDISLLEEAYRSGYEVGDLTWAYTSINHLIAHKIFIGDPLSEIKKQYKKYYEPLKHFKQIRLKGQFELFFQFIATLIHGNGNDNNCKIKGNFFDEDITIPQWQHMHDHSSLGYYSVYKMILFFLRENYAMSIHYAEEARPHLESMMGQLFIKEYYFYYSLALLNHYPLVDKNEQKRIMKKINSIDKKIKSWASCSPNNFMHKYLLIKAEISRHSGDMQHTMEWYSEAIDAAMHNKFIQDQGLANEQTAKYLLSLGMDKASVQYLKEAHLCYTRWEASFKLDLFNARYEHILAESAYNFNPIASRSNHSFVSSTGTSSEEIDLDTVIKASQAISSEIVLQKLLVKLMRLSLANAGAEKGHLLLAEDDKLSVEVKGEINKEEITTLHSIPAEKYQNHSLAIINYVTRTRETVIIDNAAEATNFIDENYLRDHKPKSILCFPIISQAKLLGILYLENSLTSHVFTKDRVEVLKILSSQAAVSITNAKLYERLEEKVTERTRELHNVNEDLIETNKILSIQAKIADALNNDLYETNKELKKAHINAERDLKMAINIQSNFLTNQVPPSKSWEIAYVFKPMAGVSGDFYDFYEINDQLRGVGIFDVSGHGIASGLITMIAKSIFFRTFKTGNDKDLNQVLTYANERLQEEISNVDNYLTGILLRLNEDSIEYVNAGHNDIFVKTKAGVYPVKNTQGESISSFYLGVSGMSLPFEVVTFSIEKGDYILLFTDCLVESKNYQDTYYGYNGVTKALNQAPEGSTQEVLDYILDDFYHFIGRRDKLDDDLTVILVKKL